MFESLARLDVALFRAVNDGLASPWLDDVMLLVSHRNTWIVVGVVALLTAVLRRSRRAVILVLTLAATLGVSDLVTYQALKPTFARPRPCYQLEDVRLVQERCGGDFGFPSNHAANSMAMTVAVALIFRRRWAWFVAAAAVLVGLSRIYVGVHFPGDILGGFVVGGTIAWLCHQATSKLTTRHH